MRSSRKVPRDLHLPDSTARRKPDNVRSMTPRSIAHIAYPVLRALGKALPDLLPMTAAVNDELERLYPELRVSAGPSEPPT